MMPSLMVCCGITGTAPIAIAMTAMPPAKIFLCDNFIVLSLLEITSPLSRVSCDFLGTAEIVVGHHRIIGEFGCKSLMNDPALFDDRRSGRCFQRHACVLLDQQNRQSFLVEPDQRIEDFPDDDRRQTET